MAIFVYFPKKLDLNMLLSTETPVSGITEFANMFSVFAPETRVLCTLVNVLSGVNL